MKEGDPVPPGTPVLSLTDPELHRDAAGVGVGPHQAEGRSALHGQLVGGQNEEPGTISELD